MKVTFVICCVIIFSMKSSVSQGYDYDYGLDFSNLADYITRQVKNQIEHIEVTVNKNVFENLNKMRAELSHLRSSISNEVQKTLEPLLALQIIAQMARGIGGYTVGQYGDKFTLVYDNGIKNICPGDIVEENNFPKCTSKLTKIINSDERICTDSSYSRVDDFFCFGDNTGIRCAQNACTCEGGKMYNLDGLKNLCGNLYGSNIYVKYTYYPNPNDEKRIQIPNPNKHVICEEGNSYKCTWYGSGFSMTV